MVEEIREIRKRDLDVILRYVEDTWPKLIRENKKDLKSLIGLPNPYIVPSNEDIFQEQYYWDSYPVVRALINHPKYWRLAVGMVDNLISLVKRFGIVPNASRFYFLSRSQQPLLSSMIWLVFQRTGDLDWFRDSIRWLEYEYEHVWMGKTHLRNFRHVYMGLSRYYDLNAIHALAEAESGWDSTARFDGRCMDFVPIDLNCLLYLYEHDLQKAYEVLGEEKKVEKFKKLSFARERTISKLMWDKSVGYYFDFDFVNRKRSHLITIAGVYPLNVGLASPAQARRVVEVINHELHKRWGVVQSVNFVQNFQWDYPNGWPPMQLRTVEGLLRYGYSSLAKKIILRWLSLNIKVFRETGHLWEKYDVVHGRIGVPDRYPTPYGFAWTNATFLIMVKILEFLEEHSHEGSTPVWLVRRLGWL